ncbi:MAG: hypothetical protein PHF53_01900 [Bacteroidales bacterium]|nr:hypothetical protein [Bacteroidales bacterium]MDD2812150.1 hypothetical protein [Bacteroidales bacterium]MDD3871681.1 hypothetical protein [Bacteroidales bacterium]MDD4812172.1 hypothetical protein [Bacteroidales bacterium]
MNLSELYRLRPLLLATMLLILGPCTLFAQRKINLTKFETPSARLVFLDPGTSYLVPHTVRAFENALAFHQQFWNYDPSEKTNILFNDFTDVGNGGTMVIPWNYLNIAVAPFDYTYSVVLPLERMQWLMSHELTHQVMCDQSSKRDRLYQSLLGGKVIPDNTDPLSLIYSYLTTPRWYSPRWYHEGIAVFMETWMSGGLGRVMGGYDEMVFRALVKDSAYLYHVIGLETEGTTIDFQVGVNSYLYGTRFVSYLALKYGLNKLQDFFSRTDSSRRFYAAQFRQVYGKSIEEEWDDWIIWEREFQEKNLSRIREYPVSTFRQVTPSTLGSVSRPYLDSLGNQLIVAANYPGKMAHIASIDLQTGKSKKIAPVISPALYYVTSLAFDPATRTLFASTHNQDWRGLQSIDLETGKTKELIQITRCGHLVFDQAGKCLWGVQNLAGRTSLVRFKPPYKDYQVMATLPYGQDLFDLDISPDGSLISATLGDVTGRQQLVLIRMDDLLKSKLSLDTLYEFEENPASHFVFSPDGKHLYGTSYYTGVSNIFRISLETRQADIISNAETGFFRPLPLSADSLLCFNYTHEGMVPGIMAIEVREDVNAIEFLGQQVYERHPQVEEWALPPPSTVNLDSIGVTEKTYHPMRELRLSGAYPIIQGYKQYLAVGYRLNFMDPMGINSLNIKLSVTPYADLPTKQVPHLSAEYRFWGWTFTGSYNYADFFDLFGPTRFSRAGYSFSGKYHKVFRNFAPGKTELSVRLAMYGDLETLPDYQNVASDFRNLYTGYVHFHRSRLRRSLGAIEPEQGYNWNVYAYTSLAEKTFYPQLIHNLDLGLLLPIRHTSLWLRTSAGQSFGPPDKTNSHFYFGGFGNNYLDYRDIRQYRDMASFPGAEINELQGLNYAKLCGELNLPPVRFRKLGFKGLYATHAQATLFGMGLFTNMANQLPQKTYYSSGLQINLEIVLFSLMKSTFSFGFSRAYNLEQPGNQFMFSLKL